MRIVSLALVLVVAAPLALSLSSCGKEVTRVDNNNVRDLSGNWNDTDSKQTAEQLVADLMKRTWPEDFAKANGKKPVVRIGQVVVRANEVISTKIFTNDLLREIINSGRAEAVASQDEAANVRGERADTAVNAADAKANFNEAASDYLLFGEINVQNDQEGGKARKFYSVDMKTTDSKTNKIVWIGNVKFTKNVDQ